MTQPQTVDESLGAADEQQVLSRLQDDVMQVRVTGDGPPIVLVGGGLTGWTSWEQHVAILEGTRTVATLQPLGVQYGLEDRSLPSGYGIPMEASALERALDGIGWTEPVDVVGWSYGALVALELALNHPERIRTLTLIEPPALWVLEDQGKGDPGVEAIRSLKIGDTIGAAELEQFLRAVGIVSPDADPRSLPQWKIWFRHRRSLRIVATPLYFNADRDRLASLDLPVLLVTGTGTAPFHRRIHEELAVRLPRARSIELPGGHGPHLAAMDAFLAELKDFQSARYATSKDGTQIGFVARGSGPAVLFVHGTSADRNSWMSISPFLEQHVTLYAMDRRGRGLSGDGHDYDLAREAEDVVAVVDAIGGPVALFGHSFGGLCALEAARLTRNIKRLILYEPPIPGDEPTVSEVQRQRLRDLVQRGELEAAMLYFLQDVALIDEDGLEAYAQTPLWKAQIPVTPTVLRELDTEETYTFDPSRFRTMTVPTTLLLGGESPAVYREAVKEVHAALPQSEVIKLDGQQHVAHHAAPELLARVILRSLGI